MTNEPRKIPAFRQLMINEMYKVKHDRTYYLLEHYFAAKDAIPMQLQHLQTQNAPIKEFLLEI